MSNKKESDMQSFEEMMKDVATLNEAGQRTAAIFAQGYMAGMIAAGMGKMNGKEISCQKAG